MPDFFNDDTEIKVIEEEPKKLKSKTLKNDAII